MSDVPSFEVITAGLRFPEGPIALPNGRFIVVEIAGQALTMIEPDGSHHVLAQLDGGPNGAAMGPDGWCYVCNSGGWKYVEENGQRRPIGQAEENGWIERVNIKTGAVEKLYTHAGDIPMRAPNDIIFDTHGGFYFTDLGKRGNRQIDWSSVYYAKPDGSSITEVIHPIITPNGVGLSPDGKTLYVAETLPGRLWAFGITSPGQLEKQPWPSPNGGRLVAGVPGYSLFDSMAVDSAGNICVATLFNGGITIVSPDGKSVEHMPMPDIYTTNICFGGPNLQTAYITLSSSGRLVKMPWPRPGTPLAHLNFTI